MYDFSIFKGIEYAIMPTIAFGGMLVNLPSNAGYPLIINKHLLHSLASVGHSSRPDSSIPKVPADGPGTERLTGC